MSSAIMHIDSPGLTPPPPLTAVFETRSTDKAGNGDIEEGVSDEEMPEVDGAGDDYELERAENIKNNAALLQSLGLAVGLGVRDEKEVAASKALRAGLQKSPSTKSALSSEEQRIRREARARAAALKRDVQPTRRSGRVAAQGTKVEYSLDDSPASSPAPIRQVKYDPIPKKAAPIIPTGPEYDVEEGEGEEKKRQPRPSRREDGTLIFEDRWKNVFTPNVTPEEMFKGGAFGGSFFCDTYSNSLRQPLSASTDVSLLPFTFPPSLSRSNLSRPDPDGSVNRFKVRAGQSLQEWEKAGWIWGGDPRGWAQWYVRFWDGRRGVDDERQVRRWLKVAGPTGRFKNALLKKVHHSGGKEAVKNEDVGRVVRQTLWQWGYELTLSEYERAMQA